MTLSLSLAFALNSTHSQFHHCFFNAADAGDSSSVIHAFQEVTDDLNPDSISTEQITEILHECIPDGTWVRSSQKIYLIPFRLKTGSIPIVYAVLAKNADDASIKFTKIFKTKLMPCGYLIRDVVSYPYIELSAEQRQQCATEYKLTKGA